MRLRPAVAVLLCAALTATACSSQNGPEAEGDRSSARTAVGSLPSGPCAGVPVPAPDEARAEVTFVTSGRLYAVRAGGGRARCVVRTRGVAPRVFAWGPQADRVLLGATRAVLPSGRVLAAFESGTAGVGWSQPAGKSVLAVTADGRLLKRRTIEAEPVDITFLARHDEAVYHPAGRHVLSVGEATDGTFGVFLATNQGTDVQALVVGEEARRIYSLGWVRGGQSFRFVADHGDHRDVHELDLEVPGLTTLRTTRAEIVRLATSPFEGPPYSAVQLGSCEGRTRVEVEEEDGTWAPLRGPAASRSLTPVGWLPDGRLVTLARDRGCTGPGDVHVWSGGQATLLVRHVEAAAVRAVYPPAPEPPPSSHEPPPA